MLNSGDIGWVLSSAAMVLLMTPAVAIFYGGLVPARNVINTMSMSFICLGVIPITWAILGYSFTFDKGNLFMVVSQILN